MNYNRDHFIFGESIETNIGTVRFLTYKEFLLNQSELSLIGMNILHIFYHFKNQLPKNAKNELLELEKLKEVSLWEFIMNSDQFHQVYRHVFDLLVDFKDGMNVDNIFETKELFDAMRQLVMDMNVIVEEEVSPNEEIQRGIERSRRVKQDGSEKQSFVDIITSIVAQTSNDFEKVNSMNVIQIYSLYARLNAIFNYQTSTLFATVAEKVNIELWNKHIDLFERKSDTISKTDFENSFGGLF